MDIYLSGCEIIGVIEELDQPCDMVSFGYDIDIEEVDAEYEDYLAFFGLI